MSPAALLALRRFLTWRTIRRTVALVLVLMIASAAAVYHTKARPPAPPICGTALADDPFAVRWFKVPEKTGSLIARLMTEPLPSDQVFAEYFFGTFDVLKWWGISVLNPIRAAEHMAGLDGGNAGINPYTTAVPCTPPAEACVENPPPDPAKPEDLAPWDPKNASLSGAALAADALRKAGFPASEIPTFVAIAKHETGFRNISGPTVGAGTMRGMWQLNDQYWKLDNWADPYANAVMAKRVRDESVEVGNGPYYPWSTWRAAVRDADQFARFASNSPTPPTSSTRPSAPIPLDPMTGALTAPDCAPGVGGVTVGPWNTAEKIGNTPARINAAAGFADVVGLQEIRRNSAIKVPGYGITEGNMAVPIIWNTAKLDLIKWKRETAYSSRAGTKSVVWAIFRTKETGQQFAVVNTHQYVNGGFWWDVQARKVNAVRARLEKLGMPVVLLGDMNETPGKVAAAFGSSGVGGRIDRIIGYGAKPTSAQTLSKAGSDHHRIRVAFPAASTPPATSPAVGVPADFDQQGNPRTVEQAIAWLRAATPNGAPGERVSNRCERYMNLAYGLGGGYSSAGVHWRSPGPKHQGDPPAGALVFWDTSGSNDHVALSVGGGRVISTDFDGSNFRSGVISEGPIEAIDKWGPRLGWRVPNFNVGSGK